MKGIDKSFNEDEVCEDLKRQFRAVVKVKQLSKESKNETKVPIGVYIVYFEWNTILSVPQKIVKYFGTLVIGVLRVFLTTWKGESRFVLMNTSADVSRKGYPI